MLNTAYQAGAFKMGCGCGGKSFSQSYGTGMRAPATSHVPSQRPMQSVNVQQSKSLQSRSSVQVSVQSHAQTRRKV
jgi:hypothetical protein